MPSLERTSHSFSGENDRHMAQLASLESEHDCSRISTAPCGLGAVLAVRIRRKYPLSTVGLWACGCFDSLTQPWPGLQPRKIVSLGMFNWQNDLVLNIPFSVSIEDREILRPVLRGGNLPQNWGKLPVK
eukprot:g52439.t1